MFLYFVKSDSFIGNGFEDLAEEVFQVFRGRFRHFIISSDYFVKEVLSAVLFEREGAK
jgi:hypothetical protein